MNTTIHETNGRPATTQNIAQELHAAELHLAAQVDAASDQAATICENGGALDLAVGRYAHEITSAQQRLATMGRAVHQMAGSLLSSLTGTLAGLQGMFAPFECPAPVEAIGRAGAPRFPGSLLPLDTLDPEEQQEFAGGSTPGWEIIDADAEDRGAPPWGDDGLPGDVDTNYPGGGTVADEPDANTPPPADEPAPVPAPEESRAVWPQEPHGGDHEDEVKHEVEAIDHLEHDEEGERQHIQTFDKAIVEMREDDPDGERAKTMKPEKKPRKRKKQ